MQVLKKKSLVKASVRANILPTLSIYVVAVSSLQPPSSFHGWELSLVASTLADLAAVIDKLPGWSTKFSYGMNVKKEKAI